MPTYEHTAQPASPTDGIATQVEAMRSFWTERLDHLERLSENRGRSSALDVLGMLLSRFNHLGEPGDPTMLVALDRRRAASEREREIAISTYILISG